MIMRLAADKHLSSAWRDCHSSLGCQALAPQDQMNRMSSGCYGNSTLAT